MGKWVAEVGMTGWLVRHEDGRVLLATSEFTAPIDEHTARAYALALNIVDAGVDLGEAVALLKMFSTDDEQLVNMNTDIEFVKSLMQVRDYLRSIANAVEGDTTKEDV